jgi:hypothetical protein
MPEITKDSNIRKNKCGCLGNTSNKLTMDISGLGLMKNA